MAGFEGIEWAPQQMRFVLGDKCFDLLDPNSKVSAVSRSTHYGLCLAFCFIDLLLFGCFRCLYYTLLFTLSFINIGISLAFRS